MSNSFDPQLHRRDFLRAAGLLGAATLGGGALASDLFTSGDRQVTLAYFDGTTLIPVERIPAGDAQMEAARITVYHHGGSGSIKTLDALFRVPGLKGGLVEAPFTAWVQGGTTRTRFEMPVVDHGLSLRVNQASSSTSYLLHTIGAGPKLVAGTYVLVGGGISLKGYRFEPENIGGPLFLPGGAPVTAQYLVLTFERV